jgi:hypothetical protein
MGQLLINTVTGFTVPFSAYTCDVYGNQCVYLGVISALPTLLTLPPQFNMAPAIGLKIIGSSCERFEILYCADIPPQAKQFQDSEFFFFMDNEIFRFQ